MALQSQAKEFSKRNPNFKVSRYSHSYAHPIGQQDQIKILVSSSNSERRSPRRQASERDPWSFPSKTRCTSRRWWTRWRATNLSATKYSGRVGKCPKSLIASKQTPIPPNPPSLSLSRDSKYATWAGWPTWRGRGGAGTRDRGVGMGGLLCASTPKSDRFLSYDLMMLLPQLPNYNKWVITTRIASTC